MHKAIAHLAGFAAHFSHDTICNNNSTIAVQQAHSLHFLASGLVLAHSLEPLGSSLEQQLITLCEFSNVCAMQR